MRALNFLGTVLLVSMPGYAMQSDPPQGASAQPDNTVLLQKMRDLEDRVIALEGQIRQMKAQEAPAAPPAPAPGNAESNTQAAGPTPQSQPPAPGAFTSGAPVVLGGAGGSAAKALNPDISAIGDFISVAGHNPVQPSPSLEMHESELGFQAIIDPYARGDFFLSFGEQGVDPGRGLHHLHRASRRICGQGGKDAIRLWQGEHSS